MLISAAAVTMDDSKDLTGAMVGAILGGFVLLAIVILVLGMYVILLQWSLSLSHSLGLLLGSVSNLSVVSMASCSP